MKAKAFAERAGVTVRTLHFYDREGLLKPASRTDAGYRVYSEADLERLEQILALRFVGFGIEQIKQLLAGPPKPLLTALRMQRAMIVQEQHRLQRAIDAIDRAAKILEHDEEQQRWPAIKHVIEVFKMERDWSWTENYYSPEAREKIAEMRRTTSREVIEKGERDWAELIAEVEASVHEDPAGEHAQQLVARWKDLVGQFTKGDKQVHEGLNKLYNDQTHWPKDFKRPWSDAAHEWIMRAMNCNVQ